jgi:hypothetical protein
MSEREDIDWEREEGGVKNGGVVVDEDVAGEINGGEIPVEADHATMLTDNAGPRTLFKLCANGSVLQLNRLSRSPSTQR